MKKKEGCKHDWREMTQADICANCQKVEVRPTKVSLPEKLKLGTSYLELASGDNKFIGKINDIISYLEAKESDKE